MSATMIAGTSRVEPGERARPPSRRRPRAHRDRSASSSAARASSRRRRRPARAGRRNRRPARGPSAGGSSSASGSATASACAPRRGAASSKVAPWPAPSLVDGHLAAVHLDQMLDDRQAEPEAAVGAGEALVGLPEALEHVGQELAAGCPTPVSVMVTRICESTRVERDVDAPARRRELDGVRQQVPEHLLQPLGVAVHARRPVVDVELEPMPLASAAGRTVSMRVADDARERRPAAGAGCSRPVIMRETSRTSAISCACALALRSTISSTLATRAGSTRACPQHRHPAEDGVERRPQLVRQRGEELVLQPVGLLGVARARSVQAPSRARRAARTGARRPRSAARTVLMTAATRIGRSSSVTLRSTSSVRSVRSDAWLRSPPANSSSEMSDHAGCVCERRRTARRCAGSAERFFGQQHGAGARAGSRRRARRAERADVTGNRRACASSCGVSAPSRPIGAQDRARGGRASSSVGMQQGPGRRRRTAGRRSGRRGTRSARLPTWTRSGPELQLADGRLVRAGPLLHDRDRPPDVRRAPRRSAAASRYRPGS